MFAPPLDSTPTGLSSFSDTKCVCEAGKLGAVQRLSEDVGDHTRGRTELKADQLTDNFLTNEMMSDINMFRSIADQWVLRKVNSALIVDHYGYGKIVIDSPETYK